MLQSIFVQACTAFASTCFTVCVTFQDTEKPTLSATPVSTKDAFSDANLLHEEVRVVKHAHIQLVMTHVSTFHICENKDNDQKRSQFRANNQEQKKNWDRQETGVKKVWKLSG